MRYGARSAPGVGIAVLAVLAALAASAQDASDTTPGALTLRADITSAIEFRNLDGSAPSFGGSETETYFRNRLAFTLGTATPTSQLSATFGGYLQYEDTDGVDDNGWADPFFDIRYFREGADSDLTLTARRSTSDLYNTLVLDLDEDGLADLFFDSIGTVTRNSYGGSIGFGTNSPLGFRLDARLSERDYKNTVDPDLFDSETRNLTGTLTARLSPTAELSLTASRSEYEAEDTGGTERDTDRYAIGVSYDISPILSFSGNISDVEITETNSLEPTVVQSEREFVFRLDRELPNGAVFAEVSREVFTLTERDIARVGGSVGLPTGSLSASVGISRGTTGEETTIGQLRYSQELPTGLLSASLDRTVEYTSNDEEVARMAVGLSYAHELTPLARLLVGADYIDQKNAGLGAAADDDRTRLELGFQQELTEDWGWNLSYEATWSDGGSNTSSLSASISRSFNFRP